MTQKAEIFSPRDFINEVREHVVLAFDFDGVLADSEAVAAGVTVKSVNRHLDKIKGEENHKPLTLEYVCSHLSGLNFVKQQVPAIEKLFGVTFPPELVAEKEAGNLTALSTETRSIPGAANGLRFIKEHCLNSIGVTQSNPTRVKGTIGAPGCHDIRDLITTDLEEGLCRGSHDTILLSAGETIHYKGREIPKLPSKPNPAGYDLAYEIATDRVPEFKDPSGSIVPIPMQIFEDSDTGGQAAAAAKHTAKVGIIALGGHVAHDPEGHVNSMKKIVGEDRAIIIRPSQDSNENPWIPAYISALQLGLDHARATTSPHLPAQLPESVVEYVRNELNRDFNMQPMFRPMTARQMGMAPISGTTPMAVPA